MDLASTTLTGLFVWSSVATSSVLTPPEAVVAPAEPVAPIEEIADDVTIKELVENEFGRGHVMVHIARCESHFRQFNGGESLRGRVNPKDIGIFQINEKYHLATAKKKGLDIHTVEGNIEYARYLYDTKGTAPWIWSKPCWGKKA